MKPKTIPIATLLIEVFELESRRIVAAKVKATIDALKKYEATLAAPTKRRAA